MGKSRSQAESTVDLSGNVGDDLTRVSDCAQVMRDMTTQIATAAEEQAQVVGDVNRSLLGISDASRDVTASGKGNTRQAALVERLTHRLSERIAHFKLP
jgi:methyl-accepting chemotaxis protein